MSEVPGANSQSPNQDSMRYMLGNGNDSGPQFTGKNGQSKQAKKKNTDRVPLGNFTKMISTTLRKSPSLLLQDGEFPKIVRKGAQEIIQALHKTNDAVVMSQRLEQFVRCEKMLKNLNDNLISMLNQTAKSDLTKRNEISEVAEIVGAVLRQFKNEAAFLNQVKENIANPNKPLVIQEAAPTNKPTESEDLPYPIIGMIASFLPKEEVDALLNPLLDQFAKKGERSLAKATATQEAFKGEKLAGELTKKIVEALKTQGDKFVFPEELRQQIQFVTSLDLSSLGVPLRATALKELISNWPHLTDLNLSGNTVTKEIVDLLGDLKDLRHLNLRGTQLNDSMLLTLIEKHPNLQSLTCAECPITTLQPLTSFKNLQSLDCTSCPITTLQPLSLCTNLQSLYCDDCQAITTLQPLSSCTHLQLLSCQGCGQITTLQPLSSCTNLQDLNCSDCPITTLQPLSFCINLQSLTCVECPITTLQPLSSCTNLLTLWCYSCPQITSLQPLSLCTRLQSLYCGNCPITTLQPLSSCTNLQNLDFGECPVTTLQPLSSCVNLQTVNCRNCRQIFSLQPLFSCSNLQLLDCRTCPQIISEEKSALKQALPRVFINDTAV